MADLFQSIKSIYFFKGLHDDEIKKIQRVCHKINYKSGDVIFKEGEQADRFYIVLEGAVEVWKDYYTPEKDLLAVHGKGHLFGEMALIDELPRSATVIAREESRLYYINRKNFHEIIMDNSRIALSIMISVSSMVRMSNETFVNSLRRRNKELEKTNAALEEAHDELLRKDRLSTLGKFSSLILHDIRNPISVLRGLAEMILLHTDDKERIERNSKRIIQELDQLNSLASELLDFSRGEIRLNMSIVNISDFFKQVIESIEDKLKASNILIRTDISVSDPIIFDSQRMFRVFRNLADNARKAMSSGGILTIKAAKDEKTLRIEFADTGVGMHPNVQKKIFDPFFSHSDRGGTGLGMSIVKSVIEAHNGTLSVESKEQGGTTFRIMLPLFA